MKRARNDADWAFYHAINSMTHLVYLTTTKFVGAKEEANPYNPIAGKALLSWLREQLSMTGWRVTEPDAEDWGWFIIVQKSGDSYLVGASGEMNGDNMSTDWIIQIHKNRTFIEKLTGKNKLLDGDLLTREIEGVVLRDTGTEKVNVDLNA
jgi:hypothetical protein